MTWVPPAYRQPGQEWPPLGAPHRHRSKWWFPVLGGVATALALGAAYLVTLMVVFVTSVCNDSPSVVNSHRNSLRVWLIVVWLVAAGIPSLVAGLAKVRNRTRVPWIAAAVLIAGFGLAIGLTARPATWCLF